MVWRANTPVWAMCTLAHQSIGVGVQWCNAQQLASSWVHLGDVSIAGPILICAEGENLDNGYMTPNLALNVDLLQNGHETTL